MIDIKNLAVQFTGENLFEEVNLKIHKHDKIALVGSNGKGKSTFFKLLLGLEKPENGEIIRQKGLRIGYLPQDFISFKGKILFDEVKSSLIEIKTIIEREAEILGLLNQNTIDDDDRAELIEELGELHLRKEELDFYSAESRIEKILIGLGFKESDFVRTTDQFSGGWQMRIQLAKILLAENHLILLDEPTNHLDIDTLTWLIEFLNSYKGALIVISHDRHFVNSVTDKTLEIFNRRINFFPGNYDHYLKFKEQRDNELIEAQKILERKIKETERFIERFRYKASKAKQVQSRIKQLAKLDTVQLMEEEKVIDLRFPAPPKSGVIPVEAKNLTKSYGSLEVLKSLSFQIERGDKIAVVGPNGAGKTTLTKIIGGKIDTFGGELIYGHNTIVSFFEQEATEGLNPEHDLIDALEEVNNELTPGQLRKILGSFLFSGEDVFKKIKVLSGGEKSRLALARLLLMNSNLIVLDEPTNHLDFTSKAVLQKALIEFSGTLVIVSHDIDFLRHVVSKVFEMRDGRLKIYAGGIDYYLGKRKELPEPVILDSYEAADKVNRKEQKRIEAEQRQKKYLLTKELKRELELCENEIVLNEEKMKRLEQELIVPEVFKNPQLAKEKNLDYEKTKKQLELLYSNWAELTARIEEIEAQFSTDNVN